MPSFLFELIFFNENVWRTWEFDDSKGANRHVLDFDHANRRLSMRNQVPVLNCPFLRNLKVIQLQTLCCLGCVFFSLFLSFSLFFPFLSLPVDQLGNWDYKRFAWRDFVIKLKEIWLHRMGELGACLPSYQFDFIFIGCNSIWSEGIRKHPKASECINLSKNSQKDNI